MIIALPDRYFHKLNDRELAALAVAQMSGFGPTVLPVSFIKAASHLPPQAAEAATLTAALQKTWLGVTVRYRKLIEAAFKADGTVDLAKLKAAEKALPSIQKILVKEIRPEVSKILLATASNAREYFIDQAKRLHKVDIQKATNDFDALFAERYSDHIASFMESYPERRIHPEIDRLVKFLEANPETRGAELDELKFQLRRVTSAKGYSEEMGLVGAARIWNATGLQMAREGGASSYMSMSQNDWSGGKKGVCPVCWFLHGKVFRAPQAAARLNDFLGSQEDPQAARQNFPFPRYDELDTVSFEEIRDRGYFPPYHPHCRCYVVPLWGATPPEEIQQPEQLVLGERIKQLVEDLGEKWAEIASKLRQEGYRTPKDRNITAKYIERVASAPEEGPKLITDRNLVIARLKQEVAMKKPAYAAQISLQTAEDMAKEGYRDPFGNVLDAKQLWKLHDVYISKESPVVDTKSWLDERMVPGTKVQIERSQRGNGNKSTAVADSGLLRNIENYVAEEWPENFKVIAADQPDWSVSVLKGGKTSYSNEDTQIVSFTKEGGQANTTICHEMVHNLIVPRVYKTIAPRQMQQELIAQEVPSYVHGNASASRIPPGSRPDWREQQALFNMHEYMAITSEQYIQGLSVEANADRLIAHQTKNVWGNGVEQKANDGTVDYSKGRVYTKEEAIKAITLFEKWINQTVNEILQG
jgi:hypothetical protein